MAPQKRSDSPLWRDFEQLVARIEQVLVGDSTTIVSPDRVRSLITGRLREVDASIRTRIGSADLLVTIECRKRRAKQDVTWVEQLRSKMQAIGAARTIAVASSDFSSDAVRAAEHYGIDLRVLSEINDADIQSWILPRFVVHVFKECDLVENPEILFDQEQGDDFASEPAMAGMEGASPTPDLPVLVGPGGEVLTLNDMWIRADDQLNIFDTVPKDDKPHVRRICIEPSDELRLHTRVGLRRVRRIKMALSLRWKHEYIPRNAANVVTYGPANPADPMHLQVRAEFESKEAATSYVRFGMQFQPGKDEAHFSIQLLPGKK